MRPRWCVIGARVDYHALIGGPVTQPNMRIRGGPERHASSFVVWLDGKAGCVAIEALTPAGSTAAVLPPGLTAAPTGPTLWYYSIPPESDGLSGWGHFVLGSNGFFAAVTDYGDYAYKWPTHCNPRPFREMFVEFGASYVRGKIAPAKHFNVKETVREIKRWICEQRRQRSIGARCARCEWILADEIHCEYEYVRWHEDTSLPDAFEQAVYSPSHEVMTFVERLLPRLQTAIRSELAADATGEAP